MQMDTEGWKMLKISLKRFRIEMAATIVVALACFVIALQFFDNPRISAQGAYNAGVDVLGAFICIVLMYGCLNQLESATYDLISLIVLTSLSFFNNICLWFVSKVPDYRFIELILSTLLHGLDIGLTFYFYQYVRKALEFKGKTAAWADRASRILLIPFFLLLLLNLFVPICFSVDAEGAFQKEAFYRLIDLYLVIIAPLAAFLILRFAATRRQKFVSLSFIIIPIIHYLFTGGAFGYATQYASVLLALIMMYCVLFTDRSRQMAVTQSELQTATDIQASMLPHAIPPFPQFSEFTLFASMDPAREVGGDFYDFYLIDEDHLCMVIADVSGKGVPAALFMMISKVILQSCAMLGQSASEILRKTNEAICSHNEVEMFVTVWLGILEISTGRMTCANAGHEFPAFRPADGQFALYKDKHGFVVGGMPGMNYKEYELQLHPGDTLFLYTDGLPEATNQELEAFGIDRMIQALNHSPDLSPQSLIVSMRLAVEGFVRGAEQFDDLTMLCIQYHGKT